MRNARSHVTLFATLVTVAMGQRLAAKEVQVQEEWYTCFQTYQMGHCNSIDMETVCNSACGWEVNYWRCDNNSPHAGWVYILCGEWLDEW